MSKREGRSPFLRLRPKLRGGEGQGWPLRGGADNAAQVLPLVTHPTSVVAKLGLRPELSGEPSTLVALG
jgi:hypothetical protein